MRDLNECRDEIFKRGEERIKARRKKVRRTLMCCVPLCLTAAVLCALLPVFLSVGAPTKNGSDGFTEDGAETIHYFTNDISPAIQHDIDEFLKEKHYELKNEMSVKADYFENSNMEYSVRCQVIEQGLPLIDLTVTAPTESEAATIANNWQKRNQEIYALVMAKLL